MREKGVYGGGQYVPRKGGQFGSRKGGQFTRVFHLGHSNTKTTENYLADFEIDTKRKWAKALGKF